MSGTSSGRTTEGIEIELLAIPNLLKRRNRRTVAGDIASLQDANGVNWGSKGVVTLKMPTKIKFTAELKKGE